MLEEVLESARTEEASLTIYRVADSAGATQNSHHNKQTSHSFLFHSPASGLRPFLVTTISYTVVFYEYHDKLVKGMRHPNTIRPDPIS
jgi:hypothetical protein